MVIISKCFLKLKVFNLKVLQVFVVVNFFLCVKSKSLGTINTEVPLGHSVE